MHQIHTNKKQKSPKQTFQLIFTNSSLLLSQKVSEASISTLPVDSIPQSISNTISSQQAPSEIYEQLNFYRQKAIVAILKNQLEIGIRAYKEVNEKQHLAAMYTLIHASKSILGDSIPINNFLNTVNATPEFSSDDTKRNFLFLIIVVLIM
ncbi:4820_t:CDS:2 [Entrophospora sp. SA101]|nr:9997_t:CDS:2 [Entrophospora sp. SA101]CAJ0827163.1 4820_t:CDS:2 [Entrophospora sp. SA101]